MAGVKSGVRVEGGFLVPEDMARCFVATNRQCPRVSRDVCEIFLTHLGDQSYARNQHQAKICAGTQFRHHAHRDARLAGATRQHERSSARGGRHPVLLLPQPSVSVFRQTLSQHLHTGSDCLILHGPTGIVLVLFGRRLDQAGACLVDIRKSHAETIRLLAHRFGNFRLRDEPSLGKQISPGGTCEFAHLLGRHRRVPIELALNRSERAVGLFCHEVDWGLTGRPFWEIVSIAAGPVIPEPALGHLPFWKRACVLAHPCLEAVAVSVFQRLQLLDDLHRCPSP